MTTPTARTTPTTPTTPTDVRFDLDTPWGSRPSRFVGGHASLGVDGDHLVLTWDLRVAVPLSVPEGQRRFTDRLWEYDVVELFLARGSSADERSVEGSGERSDEAYVEMEFAASGHWWAAAFTAPRERARLLETLAPVIDSDWNANSWTGTARIDRETIERVIGKPPWRGLCAALLSGPEPDSGPRPRIAIPSTTLPGSEPDFHQPTHWPEIALAGAA